jgi:hypothetical protein
MFEENIILLAYINFYSHGILQKLHVGGLL